MCPVLVVLVGYGTLDSVEVRPNSVSCNRPLFITKRSSSSSAQVGPFPAFSSFHMVNEEGIPFMQRDGFLNGISHILVDDADL